MNVNTYKKSITLGFICILSWCVFSALGKVLVFNENQTLNPFVLSFYLFMITLTFYLVINAARLRQLIRKCKGQWQLIFLINLTTLGSWGVLMYPLKYMEPALVDSIALSIGPIATLLLGTVFYRRMRTSRLDYLIAAGLVLAIIYTIIITLTQHTALTHISFSQMLISILLCLIAGISSAAFTIFSKRLQNNNFTPSDILVMRFWLSLLGSVLLIYASHKSFALNQNIVWHLVSLTFVLLIVPVYLIQVSIRHLEPITVVMVIPLMPLITFIFEYFNRHLHLTAYSLIAIVTSGILIIAGAYMRYKRERSENLTLYTEYADPHAPLQKPL